MKLTCCFFLLFSTVSVLAQSGDDGITIDASQLKFAKVQDSTGIGLADGALTSMEIGIDGGIIKSSDGRVELSFPRGALTSNTLISIQPCSNLAPNGVGKAYRFEPSGIQFKQPVQITIYYTDDEADVCPAEWMSLGIQDNKGRWSFVEYDEVDSLSKTLIGFIQHFSSATNVNQIALRPDRMKIPVTDSVMIEVVDIATVDTAISSVSGFAPALVKNTNLVLWYANGVQNGDEKNGRIRVSSASIGKQRLMLAQYFAPPILPRQNAVAIWAEVYRKTKKGKALTRRIKTYVEVYDRYHLSVVHESTLRVGMGSQLLDSASFDVNVYAHSFEVFNPKNYTPIVLKEGKRGPFKEKIIIGDALGTVHVTEGIKNGSLSTDYPPEVYFEFTPISILVCKFQHSGRGASTDPEPIFEKSVPKEINFIANGHDQQYNVTTGGDEYKLTVKPIRKK